MKQSVTAYGPMVDKKNRLSIKGLKVSKFCDFVRFIILELRYVKALIL